MTLKISDFKDPVLTAAHNRVGRLIDEIDGTRMQMLGGLPNTTDSSYQSGSLLSELRGRANRRSSIGSSRNDSSGLDVERQIGETDDIVSIEFLEAGLIAKRPIGKVRLPRADPPIHGTGVLVGPGMLLTNNHVLPTMEDAASHEFQLDFETSELGNPSPTFSYSCDPQKFFITDAALDFSIVAVTDFVETNPPIEGFGWHILSPKRRPTTKGIPVSIIQHPEGGPKSIVLHNSCLLHIESGNEAGHYCWYSGDTRKGSSGSPVFNKNWEVIAIHHAAVPRTNSHGEVLDRNGRTIQKSSKTVESMAISWAANEGVLAAAIFESVRNHPDLGVDQTKIRRSLLQRWTQSGAFKIAQKATMGAFPQPSGAG